MCIECVRFVVLGVDGGSHMEDVVLDVADLDAGVLRRRPVLEQRFEPWRNRKKVIIIVYNYLENNIYLISSVFTPLTVRHGYRKRCGMKWR